MCERYVKESAIHLRMPKLGCIVEGSYTAYLESCMIEIIKMTGNLETDTRIARTGVNKPLVKPWKEKNVCVILIVVS